MNADHIRQMIEIIGTDSLLFASDYPHWDFDHPSALSDHLQNTFSTEERAEILHENANEVFGLGL